LWLCVPPCLFLLYFSLTSLIPTLPVPIPLPSLYPSPAHTPPQLTPSRPTGRLFTSSALTLAAEPHPKFCVCCFFFFSHSTFRDISLTFTFLDPSNHFFFLFPPLSFSNGTPPFHPCGHRFVTFVSFPSLQLRSSPPRQFFDDLNLPSFFSFFPPRFTDHFSPSCCPPPLPRVRLFFRFFPPPPSQTFPSLHSYPPSWTDPSPLPLKDSFNNLPGPSLPVITFKIRSPRPPLSHPFSFPPPFPLPHAQIPSLINYPFFPPFSVPFLFFLKIPFCLAHHPPPFLKPPHAFSEDYPRASGASPHLWVLPSFFLAPFCFSGTALLFLVYPPCFLSQLLDNFSGEISPFL